jgi:predicted AAA+ superfamily ATPase
MFPRSYKYPKDQSFFLFGPRGTGKTTWLKAMMPEATRIDLLDEALVQSYLRNPRLFYEDLSHLKTKSWVVLDEVQRLPELLNYVHKLIEENRLLFALTGSSARKLKKENANMLAGRALSMTFHPLSARELGSRFKIKDSLRFGHLPMVFSSDDPKRYLESYVGTYLREEVQQEALVRNLGSFSQFMEVMTLSQGQMVNAQKIGAEVGVDRKTIENYLQILEDLLLAKRIPVFQKKAKRRMVVKPKFFYFDVGVYQTLRPRGPLDLDDEIQGVALETLVYQELTALIAQNNLDLSLSFYRTAKHVEVDLVAYGGDGFFAIESKLSSRIRPEDLSGLKLFHGDYPQAKCFLFYLGTERRLVDGFIHLIPVDQALENFAELIRS